MNNTEIFKDLHIHINGSKCKTAEDMLIEFWDKLNMPDPQLRNLNGLDDWIRDLSWIKDKYPEIETIYIHIHNQNDFLISNPELREKYLKDFESSDYWGEYQKEMGFIVTISRTDKNDIHENELDNRAALLYAEGYAKRSFNLEIISGFETEDCYIFTGGDKAKVMYGNPKFKINKKLFDIEPFSGTIKEIMDISKKGKSISI